MASKQETFIRKDMRTGWRAETRINLGTDMTNPEKPVGWQLDITTRKGNRPGTIISHVTVGKRERGCVTHRLYTDYSRYACMEPGKCTEKAIETIHAKALAMMDEIMTDVRAHYARINELIPAPDEIIIEA